MTLITLYGLSSIVVTIILIFLAAKAREQRDAAGAGALAVFLTLIAVYSLGYGFQIQSNDLPAYLFWLRFRNGLVIWAIFSWLIFIIQFSGRTFNGGLGRWMAVIFGLLTVIASALVWTSPFHTLVGSNPQLNTATTVPTLTQSYGPGVLVVLATYVTMRIAGVLLLVGVVRKRVEPQRTQASWLLVIIAVNLVFTVFRLPVLSVLIDLLGPIPWAIAAMLYALILFRYRLFDIKALAYEVLFTNQQDGLLVLDENRSIIAANEPARTLMALNHDPTSADGEQTPAGTPDPVRDFLNLTPPQTRFLQVATGNGTRYLQASATQLQDEGETVGGLIQFHDVTDLIETENELRTRHERLTHILESMEEVLWSWRMPSMEATFVSSAVEALLGYTPDDFLSGSLHLTDILHPQDRVDVDASISELVTRGYRVSMRRFVRADGRSVWVELRTNLISDEDGNPVRIDGIMSDKTAEMESRELEGTMAAVFAGVGEGILTFDDGGRITLANAAAHTLFDYPDGALIGLEIDTLVMSDQASAETSILQMLEGDDPIVPVGQYVMLTGRRAGGAEFPVEIQIGSVDLLHGGLYTATMRDVTTRVEYDTMRNDFIAAITHELRTPLTAILGWSETLLAERAGPLSADQKRFIGVINTHGQRLNRVLEEIFALTRIQQHGFTVVERPYTPDTIVAGAVETVRTQFSLSPAAITVETDHPDGFQMTGDAEQLERALYNLLTNAAKFCDDTPEISVVSSVTDHEWRVEVRDKGLGIDRVDLPLIFDRFYRGQAAKDWAIQGLGIGLFITKTIIEGHNGQVGVTSGPGLGSTFWFTIPIMQADLRDMDRVLSVQ